MHWPRPRRRPSSLACLLWWTYFGWLKEVLEELFAAAPLDRKGALARDAFSLAHFFVIAGIVGFAVAIEEIVIHPADPAHGEVIASLGIGVSLFVAASALSLRLLGGPILVPRLAILGAMVALLVVTADMEPIWPLVAVAGSVFAIVLIERGGPA